MNPTRNGLAGALAALLFASLVLACGCGTTGHVTVLSFSSPNSKSGNEFKPDLEKLKKKYEDKGVVFKDINMNDPKNKGMVAQYHVTMDPTYIVLNAQGQVKEQFLGKPMSEMIESRISGLIPGKTPSATPGSMPTTTPVPPGTQEPAPTQTIPVTPSK